MEDLQRDLIGVIGSRLPLTAMTFLSETSHTIAKLVKEVKNEVLFWQTTLENKVGIELPFEPRGEPVEYWSKLAVTLENAGEFPESIIELYLTGQYEFVYIAIKLKLENKDNTQDALYGAVDIEDARSIRLILDESQFKDELSLPLGAACLNKNISLRVLLDYTTKEQARGEYLGKKLTNVLISIGNTTGFKMVMDKYPLTKGEYDEADEMLYAISTTQMSNREDLLKVFLDSITAEGSTFTFKSLEMMSHYIDAMRRYVLVSAREIQMLIDSPIFVVDKISSISNLTPEAAYVLYTLERDHNIDPEYLLNKDGIPSKYKANLLSIIVQDSELLDKAFEYAKPLVINSLYQRALLLDNTSIQILYRHYDLPKADVLKALSNVITIQFSIQAVTTAMKLNNITIDDIEVVIMESEGHFALGSIYNIIKLGVKLRRTPSSRWLIGQKLAFNCKPSGLSILRDAGFDVNSCGTDLLKHYLFASYSKHDVEKLMDYVTSYDKDVIYLNFANLLTLRPYLINHEIGKINPGDENVLDIVNKFTASIKKRDTELAIVYLNAGVSWKNMTRFDWLDGVTPALAKQPKMKEGIAYLKKQFENKILRDYEISYRLYNFTCWLKLSRGLIGIVSIVQDEESTIIAMNEGVVNINHKMTATGKYKGLDLFSDTGIVLTSVDAIRARRRALQKG